LGIDVGHLDATVLVGYPGTIASMWQQAGRAGRGEEQSLTIMIGLDNPLDQYFMRHPQDLFARSHEAALCDPGNRYVLIQHLPCAAYELPLTPADEELFGGSYVDAMIHLEDTRRLNYRRDRWFYVGSDYPAQKVGLRSAGGQRVLLLDTTDDNKVIEEIDAATAQFRVHPGAVYLYQGDSYLVTELNLRDGVALVKPVDIDYYTQPREVNTMHIVRSVRHRQLFSCVAYYGQVRVTAHVVGYARKKQFSDEVLSNEPLDLPPQTFETMAVWWDIPPEMAYGIIRQGGDFLGGLHAVEHASIAMLPLLAMCDRMDLGGISTVKHADTQRPLICVYDAYPGGIGLAEHGFETLEAWWSATLEAIHTCPCATGCPSCIQSPKCGNNNEPLDKRVAEAILKALLHQVPDAAA
jgi:DEAD/DEAH box helicase domain-containing protein